MLLGEAVVKAAATEYNKDKNTDSKTQPTISNWKKKEKTNTTCMNDQSR